MYVLAKKYWAPLLLIFVGVVACGINYTPGTFLSGWDTLHPEFNFPLAFQRIIFGVFRPEQGLGAVAGHSHMADLPHVIVLYFLSFFLPMSFLRYAYIFLCFILGPLGMYLFLRHIIPQKVVCLLASLFYMLNLGTVQNFYVPFEMFTTQFALLPFLFYFATDFLFTKKLFSFVGFVLTIIFFSPTAYASTLWYVSFFVFVSYLTCLSILLHKRTLGALFSRRGTTGYPARMPGLNGSDRTPHISRTLFLISIFFLLNFYWILPNLYFILVHGKEVTQAATNQLFSEEAFLYNKKFGNVQDILLLKTFYFDWSIFDHNTFTLLMKPWITYLSMPLFSFVGYIFAILAGVGLFMSIYKRKIMLLSFLPGLVIALIFLINDNLPFHLYGILQKIPLFQEAFRFPDDKILGVFVFIYTIFLSVGLFHSFVLIQKVKIPISITKFIYPLFFIIIILPSFPVFTGHLIHPAMRIQIPQDYFQLFSYMQKQPNGRIATFPINSPWGWEYYDWRSSNKPSFQGSGFISFGLKDPILDRDFDRWNSQNESYYQEMSYAVYSQNETLLQNVIKKYDISYILLDTSIIAPEYKKSVLFYKEINKLLAKNKNLKLTAQIQNHLFVYKIISSKPLITTTKTLPIAKSTQSTFADNSYIKNGTYQDSAFSQDLADNLDRERIVPEIVTASTSLSKNMFPFLTALTHSTCPTNNFSQENTQKNIIYTLKPFVEYVSFNGQYCDHVNVETKTSFTPTLVSILSRNLSGLSLRVCISDPTNGHCTIQSKLPESTLFTRTTLFVPPMPSLRFSIDIANIGISPTTSINDIADISVKELPKENLATKGPSLSPHNIPFHSLANKTIYTLSSADIPREDTTLLLSQAQEPGWQLYSIPDNSSLTPIQTILPFLFTKPVGKHITINSWENGWELPNNRFSSGHNQLVIVFLPQYLEYFGFIVSAVTLISIFFFYLKKKTFFH